jgi:hypothetical protein
VCSFLCGLRVLMVARPHAGVTGLASSVERPIVSRGGNHLNDDRAGRLRVAPRRMGTPCSRLGLRNPRGELRPVTNGSVESKPKQ